MKLAIVDPNYSKDWVEAHKAGCRDLNPKRKPVHYTVEAETRLEAAKEIGADFLDEESMTLEEVLGNIHWAPCLRDFK